MSDENLPGGVAPAPASMAEAAPAVAPAVAPTSASTPHAASPSAAAAPEPAAPLAPTPSATLLSAAAVPPTEPAAPAPEVAAESPDPVAPAPFAPFVLPEGVVLDEARIGDFTGLLSEFESATNAPREAVQAFAQKLVDRHVAELQRTAEAVRAESANAVAAQRAGYEAALQADPELGGARLSATTEAARSFIARIGLSAEDFSAFAKVMDETGLGNHPAVVRVFARAGATTAEPGPLAARRPPAQMPQSRIGRMYGGTMTGVNGGA